MRYSHLNAGVAEQADAQDLKTTQSSKPDDFDAAITNDPFVVADNADDAPKWLPDRLAVIATGGHIKRRMYYTTNQLGDFPICATVGLTSRTPNFLRDDVAERLLPAYVERFEQFGAEPTMKPIADELNKVVRPDARLSNLRESC